LPAEITAVLNLSLFCETEVHKEKLPVGNPLKIQIKKNGTIKPLQFHTILLELQEKKGLNFK
jgi:hypothetical protein